MKFILLLSIQALSQAPFASAALTKGQRAYVIQQIRSGNTTVLSHLSLNGTSLEQANVDEVALIQRIQKGDASTLTDRRLRYDQASPEGREAPGSGFAQTPSPNDWLDAAERIAKKYPNLKLYPPGYCEGCETIRRFRNGIQQHGGCVNAESVAGPGDPDGSLHLYPVRPQDRCH